MERPGFEPPLCAMSTNRSLYAIYSQMPMDRYAILHRRMTARTYNGMRQATTKKDNGVRQATTKKDNDEDRQRRKTGDGGN